MKTGLYRKKQHLTEAGLQQIINLKASINNGLSPALIAALPSYKPEFRPLIENH